MLIKLVQCSYINIVKPTKKDTLTLCYKCVENFKSAILNKCPKQDVLNIFSWVSFKFFFLSSQLHLNVINMPLYNGNDLGYAYMVIINILKSK